jgi:hypothetical protein
MCHNFDWEICNIGISNVKITDNEIIYQLIEWIKYIYEFL